jgi:hypothetical protein
LEVRTFVHVKTSPAQFIAAIAAGQRGAAHSVSGVGQAATFYTLPNGISILSAAKRSLGVVQLVIFAAPVVVPKGNLIAVDRRVLGRI